jgi:hypothetical protein
LQHHVTIDRRTHRVAARWLAVDRNQGQADTIAALSWRRHAKQLEARR